MYPHAGRARRRTRLVEGRSGDGAIPSPARLLQAKRATGISSRLVLHLDHIEGWLKDYWQEHFPDVPLIVALWGWERFSS